MGALFWLGTWTPVTARAIGIFTDNGDVGTPSTIGAGSAAYDTASRTYTVSGGGENMWAAADHFHYVWKKMSGDATLEALASARIHRIGCPSSACPILNAMKVSLDLPDDVVRQLAQEGQDLSRAALEALAIDAYRMDRITAHQLRQWLDIPSRYELDGFLKRHGVPLEYTIDDFERERETSARLREKRLTDLANPPS